MGEEIAVGDGYAANQSVRRAALILSLFTITRPGLSLSEMTALTGMNKATVHRYAIALRSANLIRRDAASGLYTLGAQVLRLGAAARAGLPILSVAGPIMASLMHDLNETVVLSVWDGEAPLVVRVEDNVDRVVRVSIGVGVRLATTTSAQGRIFSAHLPDGEVPGLRARLRSSPGLRDTLRDVRRLGLALNSPSEYGVTALAAPVFGDGEIVAALALVGTITAIAADLSSDMAQRLKDAAQVLSEALGSHEGELRREIIA